MDTTRPVVILNNGVQMPVMGFGVFQIPPEQTADAVRNALACGYRLVDTAASYNNERQVGEGIRSSGMGRAEVFVQTKLWISDYGYDSALRAFDRSLRKLGLDYVDLYLLHWPVPSDFAATVASYRALEKLLVDGLVRAIGVCNFSPSHLERLLAEVEHPPAVNQVELHPYYTQPDLREFNAAHGIVTQSWSPICGVYRYFPTDPQKVKNCLEEPVIVDLAAKYAKTPAQVVLRWHLEHGLCPIPKSARPERIAENIDVFDFELTAEEVAAIDVLDTGVRGGPDPELVDTRMFPRRIED